MNAYTNLIIRCDVAKIELRSIFKFHESSEALWKQNVDTLNGELNHALKDCPTNQQNKIVDSFFPEVQKNRFVYPNLHRKNSLLMVFNILEYQLNLLCEAFYEILDTDLQLKHIDGRGVERALLFLKKVVKIDFSPFGSEMSTIRAVNKIRNIIVHNNGILPFSENNKKIHEFISKSDNLLGIEGQLIKVHSNFIDYLIKILITFFDKLDKCIKKNLFKK